MLKIFHDWNNPRFTDQEGRVILVTSEEEMKEEVELVEGMHVLVGDGDYDEEAVLELVQQPTSKGLEDTWRARRLPVTTEKNLKVERIEDSYSITLRGQEGKERFGNVMNRWDMYLYLRHHKNQSPDFVESLFNEADANWYVEHKRRIERMRKSGHVI